MNKEDKLFYTNTFYIVALSILAVALNSVKFSFIGYIFPLGLWFMPITYYYANVITKNTDDKKTLIAITIAFLAQLLCYITMSSFEGSIIDIGVMFGTLAGFILSHLVNLLFYMNLAKPRRGRRVKYLELAFVYFTAILVNGLCVHIFSNAGQFNESAYFTMLISFAFQALIGAIAIIVDKNTKKELR